MNTKVIAQADITARVRLSAFGVDVPGTVRLGESEFVFDQMAALDARLAGGDLSDPDARMIGRGVGLLVAWRAVRAVLDGQAAAGGVVTQIRDADGSALNYAAPFTESLDALMSEAQEALGLVSFVRADRVASAGAFSLVQLNGASRQREARCGWLGPGWGGFCSGLWDGAGWPLGLGQ